ncbi:hypothetical protein J6590_058529 [Homalodisca vitripennis]|nr:hypothetical protein J6590_058529 [Homalodisca vitripennis]
MRDPLSIPKPSLLIPSSEFYTINFYTALLRFNAKSIAHFIIDRKKTDNHRKNYHLAIKMETVQPH